MDVMGMNSYSHTADHGWPQTSHDEANNNRYQPDAPLVAYCGRCRRVFAADHAWVHEEIELERQANALDWRGNPRDPEALSEKIVPIEQILMTKVNRWNPGLVITSVGRDVRGRIEIEWAQRQPAPVKQGFLIRLRKWLGLP